MSSQANEGMNFGSGVPVVFTTHIAPTLAPVLNSVPIDVLV